MPAAVGPGVHARAGEPGGQPDRRARVSFSHRHGAVGLLLGLAYQANGIEFVREPKEEAYGTVAVFKDLYGNLWDLVQMKAKA